ncbi:MAG: hypothetical protein ACKVP7_12260 [Hyphomicrobiaceae bacterium]
MNGEPLTVADKGTRYGDDLIRKGTWALIGLVALVEVIAVASGIWRTLAYRAPFTVGVAIGIACLYSFSRTPTDKRPQKLRSIAIALVLTAMVALFYAATIVRLGGNVFNRSL